MMMIDLSVTKNSEWIRQREELWKPIEAIYKEHLRKNEIDPIHHYFMTGTLRPGDNLSEEVQFDWFPIQNTEAWDYLYQTVIASPKLFEKQFYFQFKDLSKRALNPDQELEMWDYYTGNDFQPVVTARVPIGAEQNLHQFVVDQSNVIAEFSLYFSGVGGNNNIDSPKWMKRINYFITLLPYVTDENFARKTKFSDCNTRTGRLISSMFKFLFKPKFDQELLGVDSSWMEKRRVYLEEVKLLLESTKMPVAMRELWEDTKKKYGQ